MNQKKNNGISGARNKALSEASGDFVLILDHDDIIHPQSLEIFYTHLQQDKELNFIYSNESLKNSILSEIKYKLFIFIIMY